MLTSGPFLESPENFSGPEKPFLKLRLAHSVKLVFSVVVKGRKIKLTAKFRALRQKENYVTRNAPEKFRDFQETGPRPRPVDKSSYLFTEAFH